MSCDNNSIKYNYFAYGGTLSGRDGSRKSPRKGLLETRRPSIFSPVGGPILPPLRAPLKILPFLRNSSGFTHFIFRRPLFSFNVFILSYFFFRKNRFQGSGYSPIAPPLFPRLLSGTSLHRYLYASTREDLIDIAVKKRLTRSSSSSSSS